MFIFSLNAVILLVRRINKPNTFSAATESVSVANSFQLSQLVRVADLPGRRSVRSARTNRPLPAINDKLQGSVATYLRCCAVVNNQIKKCLLLSPSAEKNKIGKYLAESQART